MPTHRYPNKAIVEKEAEHLQSFHFSGAGSNLPPLNIKASTREEAEAKWRELNSRTKASTPAQTDQLSTPSSSEPLQESI